MSRRKQFMEWTDLTREQSLDLFWRLYQNGDRPKRFDNYDGTYTIRCWTGQKENKRGKKR